MRRLVLSLVVPVIILAVLVACNKRPPSNAGGTTMGREVSSVKECNIDKILKPPFLESKPQSPYYRGFALEYFTSFVIKDSNTPIGDDFFKGPQPNNNPIAVEAFREEPGEGIEVCELKVTPAAPDPQYALDSVQFYSVHYKGKDLEWKNLCPNQDADLSDLHEDRAIRVQHNEGKAIAVRGYWKNGVWDEGNGTQFTLSCLSGVVAKCVLWEYMPWKEPGNQPPGTASKLHRACVHAARAKYRRDKDSSFTCSHTRVDVFDRYLIQQKSPDAGASFSFESLWSPDGLICMKRSRWMGCDTELTEELADAGTSDACVDPPSDGGTWWNEALIAVQSSNMNRTAAGVCPSQPDAGCPPYDAGTAPSP